VGVGQDSCHITVYRFGEIEGARNSRDGGQEDLERYYQRSWQDASAVLLGSATPPLPPLYLQQEVSSAENYSGKRSNSGTGKQSFTTFIGSYFKCTRWSRPISHKGPPLRRPPQWSPPPPKGVPPPGPGPTRVPLRGGDALWTMLLPHLLSSVRTLM